MQLWPVEHFFHHKRVPVILQVPFCDEKSVQLVRVASFWLSEVTSCKIYILIEVGLMQGLSKYLSEQSFMVKYPVLKLIAISTLYMISDLVLNFSGKK